MTSAYRFIITLFLLLTLTVSSYSQDLEDIIEEISGPLELTEEQETQVGELLGKYAVQLNESMAKHEDAEEPNPQAMIGDFKKVRDAYRDDLQKVLSKDQYKKYQDLVNGILHEMFTDIAEIRLIDLKKPLSMTDEQIEQLAPVMGTSLMEIMKTVIKYGDKKMNKRTQIKIGKSLKKIQSAAKSETEKILTPEQIAAWEKMKEESKNKESEG